VKQSVCSDTNCCEIRGRPHNWIDWGSATEDELQDLLRQREEERRSYFKVDRKPTNNITWFHQSNRSCVRPREKGRNFIKTLGKYNNNYLHLTLRRLQALNGRQE